MTFFTLKYHDKEQLFNSPIDISNDRGDVLDLRSKPKEYARKCIEPRSTCTLLRVVTDEYDKSVVSYVPMVVDSEKITRPNPTSVDIKSSKLASGPASKRPAKQRTPSTISITPAASLPIKVPSK